MVMVANNDQVLRCMKIHGLVGQLVMEGKRDPDTVRRALQTIHDYPDFASRLGIAGNTALIAATKADLKLWERFDRKFFGKREDYSGLRVPDSSDPEFVWPIPMPSWATMNGTVAAMRKTGIDVWTYTNDLDWDIPTHDRDPKRDAYAVLVRNRQEADEELKNLSANQLREQKISAITCLERLRLGFFRWFVTGGRKNGKHLDVQNITLCMGSRNRDGSPPSVDWHPALRQVRVNWYAPALASGNLRARAVVS